MLLNTLKRLGRLPQLRTAWTQMSVMLQWRSPGISEPALQSPGNLRGWAQAPQRCWLSRGTAERAHAGEGISGILPVLMWPVSDLEWACTDRWVAPCHMCTFTPNSQAEGWPDLLGT